MRKRTLIAVAAVVVVVFVAGFFFWKNLPGPIPFSSPASGAGPSTLSAAPLTSMDGPLHELAVRATNSLGGAGDFQVIPSQIDLPVGALVEKGRTLAENDVACVSNPEPLAYPAPNLFPSFKISRSLAGQFGLDFEKLGTAGVDTNHVQSVTLTLKSASIMALSGDGLREVLARPQCHRAIAGRQLLLVRGYIIGRRDFQLTDVRANAVDAKADIASFKITPDGSDAISLSDEFPTRFLQIVSEVTTPSGNSPAVDVAVSLPRPAQDRGPASVGDEGRIFIQRDVADDPENAIKVQSGLLAKGYNVVKGVDRIPSQKMPDSAQVRYFNAADQAKAAAVAVLLKSVIHSNVQVVRIPLPSPAGQLEVWLARTPLQPGPGPSAQAKGHLLQAVREYQDGTNTREAALLFENAYDEMSPSEKREVDQAALTRARRDLALATEDRDNGRIHEAQADYERAFHKFLS